MRHLSGNVYFQDCLCQTFRISANGFRHALRNISDTSLPACGDKGFTLLPLTFQSHTNSTAAGGLVLNYLFWDCIKDFVYTTKINYPCIMPAAATTSIHNIMERTNSDQYIQWQRTSKFLFLSRLVYKFKKNALHAKRNFFV